MNNMARFALRLRGVGRRFSSNFYEPDYLEALKPKYPLYDALNVQIRGYDYPILESYQRYIHNLAKNMDLNVEECWAVPAQDMQITTYKPNSEVVASQFKLQVYERTVQITDMSSLQLPLLLRALEVSTPPGVTVNVLPHEEHHEEVRYIPDKDLLDLKQELEDMGGPPKRKTK